MNDPVDGKIVEDPVDRRPRRLDRVTLAAKRAGDAPADLEAGPTRRTPRADAADEPAGGFLLDHEIAETVQRPMSGHHGGIAPADQFVGDRLVVGRDETPRLGISE